LEPEKETSSPDRSSLWLLAPLGILASYFTFVLMSKRSRKSRADNPQHQFTKTIQPKETPGKTSDTSGEISATIPDPPPAPGHAENASNSGKQVLGGWEIAKRIMEIIAFLAILVYTFFAGGQWFALNSSIKLTQQQISDGEAAQAAQLIMEDFSVDILPPVSNEFMVKVKYKIRNAGNSVANELRASDGTGMAMKGGTESDVRLKPDPDPKGPSLAPGQKPREYEAESGAGTRQMIFSGDYVFYVDIAVSYRDIFGRGRITTDCLYYEPVHAGFYPCRFQHQHD
jgi:hypothetical protein